MPPRRARAASTADKPAPRSRATKRASSPESEEAAPPAKRVLRAAPANVEKPKVNGKANGKVNGKAKATTDEKAKPEKGKVPARVRKVPQAVNPLPTIPQHYRPPLNLFTWGSGEMSQLVMDYNEELSKPRKNAFVSEKIEEGVFGEDHAGLESVAAGGLHTLLLDEKGTIWSCGTNDNGALGRVTVNVPDPNNDAFSIEVDEKTKDPVWKPVPIHSLIEEEFRAVKIIAGDSFSAAISDEGELRAWGAFAGNQGLVGFSSHAKKQYKPVPIIDLKDEKIVAAAAGNNHLLLLTTLGNIYTLGTGEEGQLGRRVIERRKISGTAPEKIVIGTRSRKAIAIGAGNNHSFAVDSEGNTWGWGVNSKGQTGTGVADAHIDREVHSPKRVIGLSREELGGSRVVQIAGGDLHTLFLVSDGRVFACGLSEEGRLGLADDHPAFEDRKYPDFLPEPVQVVFPDADDPVVHIAVGTNNNLAVTAGGAMYSWGRQVVGELGLGDSDLDFQKTPAVVVRREGGKWAAVSASAGGQHCLALLRSKDQDPVPVGPKRPDHPDAPKAKP
ncbi:regulator of chromosome condensation 1/beta-lactamase-inhibitor protein II [Trametes elegans]|nr:regulator of chromosome condensation 1/beta-lactamase-inhibitor protein II [Trametes elegans]